MKTIILILAALPAFGQIEIPTLTKDDFISLRVSSICEKIDTIKVSILATYNTRNEGGLWFSKSDYSQYEVVTLFIEGYAVGNNCFWRNGRIVIDPEHFKYLDPDKKPLNNKYKIWIVELNH